MTGGRALTTARLRLRPANPTDRADFMALERDPEVMRYINGGRPTPDDGIDEGAGFLMPRGTEPDIWTALEADGDVFVGWFSLRPEAAGTAALGYRLRRSCWGRGLATEGATALIDWGFRHGALTRIVASTMAVNAASRRVMEKAGMVHVETLHLDWPEPLPGSEAGDVVYEITRRRRVQAGLDR